MSEARPGGSDRPEDPTGGGGGSGPRLGDGSGTGGSDGGYVGWVGTGGSDGGIGSGSGTGGSDGGLGNGGGTEAAAGSCRDCRAPIVEGQRYCLSCGALVGDRRLDPLAHLRTHAAAVAPPPPCPAPAPRAVSLAAAATAVLVAGVSGTLVTSGDDGARAAILTRPAPAASATAPVPSSAQPADDGEPDDDTTTSAEPAAESAAAEPAAVEEPAAAEEPAPDDDPAEDPVPAEPEASDEPDDAADPEESAITPHVWLLALDGPKAQEAVARIAKQGVALTGVKPLAGETAVNATGLVTGVRPVPAGSPAPEATPSLPETLAAADRSWRAYLDVQPGGQPALPGACSAPPVGDPAAAAVASRLPFGRIPALAADDACGKGVVSLETLGNDVSAGDAIPDFSYAALGGCAPPERTAVALPDQVSDTLTAITESTEFQENGLVIVTAVGAADPCPTTPADPATPAPAPTLAPDGTLAPVPTVVLRADAKAGATLDTPADLLALTRLAATTLGVDPPGAAGGDDVPALELPAADG